MEKKRTLLPQWRPIGLVLAFASAALFGAALWLPHTESNSEDDLPFD